MSKVEAYTVKSRYLFKTGFDSYVSGTLNTIYENELQLVSVQMQIPPDRISKFISDGQAMKDVAIHAQMILPRVNIDWAVPIK